MHLKIFIFNTVKLIDKLRQHRKGAPSLIDFNHLIKVYEIANIKYKKLI